MVFSFQFLVFSLIEVKIIRRHISNPCDII